MKTRGYVAALAGFAALITGGVGLGLWWTSGPTTLEPARVELPDPGRWVVVGNTGADTATARQVREAAALTCEARGGCTGVVLLGDVVPESVADAEDPLLEQLAGSWTSIGPVYVVVGDRDVADRRHLGALMTWARDRDGVSIPSTTWSGAADGVTWLGLDSTALQRQDATAAAQLDWIDTTLAASTTRWRVALAHAPDDALCGRVTLVLTAAPQRSWQRRCSTAWISVGTGSGDGTSSSPAPDVRSLYTDPGPGFALLERSASDLAITVYGADAQATFGATLSPDGTTRLPDGTLLLDRTGP